MMHRLILMIHNLCNSLLHAKITYDLSSQPKRPGDLDLLTLKVISESHVTWATFYANFSLPMASVVDLGPMYATDKTPDSIIA